MLCTKKTELFFFSRKLEIMLDKERLQFLSLAINNTAYEIVGQNESFLYRWQKDITVF
jgi:hypothetical protein